MVLTALGSAALNAGTSLIGGAFDFISASRQRKTALELQNKQFEQQRQLIDEQNEYNNPINQMQRAKEAGVNPYFALGGAASGNQTTAGSVPNFDFNAPDGLSAFMKRLSKDSAYLDVAMKQAQIQNVQADTAKKEKETETESYKLTNILPQELGRLTETQRMLWLKNNYQEYENQIKEDVLEYEIKAKEIGFVATYHEATVNAWRNFALTRRGAPADDEHSDKYTDTFGYEYTLPKTFEDFKHFPMLRDIAKEFSETQYLVEHYAKWNKYDDALIKQINANITYLTTAAIKNSATVEQIRQNIRLINETFSDLVLSKHFQKENLKQQNEVLKATTNSIHQNIKESESRIDYRENENTRQDFKTYNPFQYIPFVK